MSFSSGTYSLVAGNPVVTGTSISSTWANNTLDDIATALSTCLLKDGTQTATAKVPFAVGIDVTTEITTTSVTFTAFAGATTSLTIGGTGATSTVAIPGTLDATSSTAASLKTAGGIAAAKAGFIGTTLTVVGTASAGITVGNTAQIAIGGTTSVNQFLAATSDNIGTYATFKNAAFGNTTTYAKARGGVVSATPTALSANDYIAYNQYFGYVGSTGGWVRGAVMGIREVGAVADNSTGLGAYFTFHARTVGGAETEAFRIQSTGAISLGTLSSSGAFGCNGATAQTAYASGGALAAYGAGTNGFDSGANASALHAMVVSIRAALVANGIMS